MYLESGSLGKQLKYANKKGFPFVVILGQQELDEGVVQIKDMQTGQLVTQNPDVLEEYLLGILVEIPIGFLRRLDFFLDILYYNKVYEK